MEIEIRSFGSGLNTTEYQPYDEALPEMGLLENTPWRHCVLVAFFPDCVAQD